MCHRSTFAVGSEGVLVVVDEDGAGVLYKKKRAVQQDPRLYR